MEVKQAIKLLNLQRFNVDSENELKKNYRAMMRKYHPDFCGEATEEIAKSINEAYEVLSERLNKLKEMDRINREAISRGGTSPFMFMSELSEVKRNKLIISLQDLIDLYNNKTVEAIGTLQNVTIDKNSLHSEDVLIDIESNITIDGIDESYSSIVKYDRKDTYEAFYDIYVDDITDELAYELELCHKRLKVNSMKGRILRVKFNFDHVVTVTVVISKRLRT